MQAEAIHAVMGQKLEECMSDFPVDLFLFHKTQKKTTLSISSSNKSLGPSHPVEGHITWLSNKPLQMEEAEIWGVVVTAAKSTES